MPTLEQTLLDHDLALLRAIAAQAGLELAAPNPRAAAAELAAALKNPEALDLLLTRALHLQSEIPNLKSEIESALALLLQNDNRYPTAAFVRRFGDLRPLGPVALIAIAAVLLVFLVPVAGAGMIGPSEALRMTVR